MSVFDNLLLPENFYFAWKKVSRICRSADGYVDHAELALFELDLENQLQSIQSDFAQGSYKLSNIRPLPVPKKLDASKPVDRQYFHVTVRDQVAWMAIVNAIGPVLDEQMPPWSYGNRLFRAAWYDMAEGRSTLERGPYRHESGNLYRKFQHSWPLFRRHIALSARAMAQTGADPDISLLDEGDRLAAAAAESDNLTYLQGNFWRGVKEKRGLELFSAGMDLERFYPNVSRKAVLKGLLLAVPKRRDPRLTGLLTDLLDFRVDADRLPPYLLKNVEPGYSQDETQGVPTGLFVAGFLCNAAMLPVDQEVNQLIASSRQIAHFRFVDDHVVIAYDFDVMCKWIVQYQSILERHSVGPTINSEKYEPSILSTYLNSRDSSDVEGLRDAAMGEARFDGSNPTHLLTKTLGLVSELAHTNIDILDDNDLRDRMKMLEWLLLADIPEREIRSDTRASFAAGQISTLVPSLAQESDGLVDQARELQNLRTQRPVRLALIKQKERALDAAINDRRAAENAYLNRSFKLLIDAFDKHPAKARLFQRLLQYCRLTGFSGLRGLRAWIDRTRVSGNDAWADYYAGLSLQALAKSSLDAARTLTDHSTMRSTRAAAANHLKSVADLPLRSFIVPRSRRAWFHQMALHELGIALLSAALVLSEIKSVRPLARRLREKASSLVPIGFGHQSATWLRITGKSAGVWAHYVELLVGLGGQPSAAWRAGFSKIFDYNLPHDRLAARRYPEYYDEKAWSRLLGSQEQSPVSDSGWIRDVLRGHPERVSQALASKKPALVRAARSTTVRNDSWSTASDWAGFCRGLDTFDPRASEWTALEIVRQVVGSAAEDELRLVHKDNVLIRQTWLKPDIASPLGWESWRHFAASPAVKMRSRASTIVDYRYGGLLTEDTPAANWDGTLTSIGQLLLGLVRHRFELPPVWNYRGNERARPTARGHIFQTLNVSSPTLLILEACLSGRSSENRQIVDHPSLFGWRIGGAINDATFDPPKLSDLDGLAQAIVRSQSILESHQIAVSMNQPRQLIPFRIADFAIGIDGEPGDTDDGE